MIRDETGPDHATPVATPERGEQTRERAEGGARAGVSDESTLTTVPAPHATSAPLHFIDQRIDVRARLWVNTTRIINGKRKPNGQRRRPRATTPVCDRRLTGFWTDTVWPVTVTSAIRSSASLDSHSRTFTLQSTSSPAPGRGSGGRLVLSLP